MYSIAIDAGTGSVRAVIFDEEGNEHGSAARDWVHLPVDGVPGSMQFDTQTDFRLVCDVIAEVLGRSGIDRREVRAISTTAMREGIVCLDAAGHEVWACANVDARAVDQVVTLRKDQDLERRIYERSGQMFALSAQPRLLWIKQQAPEIYDRVATVLMLSEWILYRLSGRTSMEPTNGSTSGLLALATRRADDDLLTWCGLKEGLVPEVAESGTAIGSLLPELADDWELPRDTAVVLGGGDTQMAAVGAGMVQVGQGLIVGGTFWQQAVNVESPRTDPDLRVRVNCAAPTDLWWAEGIAFHVGTVVRWFRDTLAAAESAEADARGISTLQVLDQAADTVPVGSHGIIPIFSDVMNYGAWKHAAPSFLNLPLDLTGAQMRAAMYRSILENAAIVAHLNLSHVEEFSGIPLQSVVFAGGGAKSRIWAQILADVTSLHVQVPVVKEATAQGAALCGFVGAGVFPDLEEASRAWARQDYAVDPNPSRSRAYDEVIERWQQAYRPQLDLVNHGVTTSLWRAPGA